MHDQTRSFDYSGRQTPEHWEFLERAQGSFQCFYLPPSAFLVWRFFRLGLFHQGAEQCGCVQQLYPSVETCSAVSQSVGPSHLGVFARCLCALARSSIQHKRYLGAWARVDVSDRQWPRAVRRPVPRCVQPPAYAFQRTSSEPCGASPAVVRKACIY